MNLYYKIVEVWPQDHLVVIRYWTDALSEEFLASNDIRKEDGTPERCRSDVSVTLPIPAPEGEELEKLLVSYAPLGWLKTLESVHNPEVDTSLTQVQSLLGVAKAKPLTEVEEIVNPGASSRQLTDEEITALINNVKTSE